MKDKTINTPEIIVHFLRTQIAKKKSCRYNNFIRKTIGAFSRGAAAAKEEPVAKGFLYPGGAAEAA